MIGQLEGIVSLITPGKIIVSCSGVGYEAEVTTADYFDLDQISKKQGLERPFKVHTHQVVKEDDLSLFAFLSSQSRDVFRELIKVNGVGPKTAIGILSCFKIAELAFVIDEKDAPSLTKVPKIGKKSAEKIVSELSGKIGSLVRTTDGTAESRDSTVFIKEDAVLALTALGYLKKDSEKVVEKVYEDGMESDALVRACLKEIK